MSKIEDLIRQFCPDGVEYVKLDEMGSFYSGLSGKSKEDFRDGNAKFITYVNIFNNPALKTDVEDKVKIADGEKQNTIQYGDLLFTGSSETPDECGMCSVLTHHTDENLYLNSFCFGFRFNDLSDKCPSFMKHLFRSTSIRKKICKTANGVTRYNISKKEFAKLEIPLPPLPVQEAIVNILDRFAVYAAELQAGLQARQQQYEYYRDTLLSFEGREDVQWKKLGELCPLITKQTGFDYSNYIKDKLVREKKENHIPYIQTKFFTGRQFDFNTDYYIPEETAARFPKIVLDTKCILLSIVGASIGNIGLYDNSQKSFLGGAIGVAKPSADVNTEFIYYYLTSHSGQKQIFHKVKGAGQATITIEDIREFLVPQPSLSEQQRIVDILDRFDTLVNDLTQGLPAEIEARQQQYEYYRDQLLTFKRKEA